MKINPRRKEKKGCNMAEHIDPTRALEGMDPGAYPMALSLAANQGHTSVVVELLQRGVNIDAVNSTQGMTALMVAAMLGRVQVVAVLLERGANLEVVDNKGDCALTLAAQAGHSAVVEALLEHGASAEAVSYGVTALIQAATLGRGGGGGAARGRRKHRDGRCEGQTALFFAGREGHAAVVATLLKGGANVAAADENGRTALMLAAYKGHVEVVDTLLRHVAETGKLAGLFKTDRDGLTARALAASAGYEAVAAALRRHEHQAESAASFSGRLSSTCASPQECLCRSSACSSSPSRACRVLTGLAESHMVTRNADGGNAEKKQKWRRCGC